MRKLLFLLLGLAPSCLAAPTPVTNVQSLARFGLITSMSQTDLVAVEINLRPRGITLSNFALLTPFTSITNGLATTNYVNTVGTTVSNGVIAEIIISSNNLLGTINVASNFLATSSIDVKTNQNRLVLQSSPISGSEWFVGTNGTPILFGRRAGLEFNTITQSVRWGSLGNLGINGHNYLSVSNYWDYPNLGFNTWAYGSNQLVNADDSAVCGGVNNLIYTNAHSSIISGGTNNSIRTNAYSSTISGGGGNTIGVNSIASTISGGSVNNIAGGGQQSVIAGGVNNNIAVPSAYCVISGGRDNTVSQVSAGTDLSKNSFIGGGEINTIRGPHSFIGGGSNNNVRVEGVGNVIVGGIGNEIGVAPGSPSTFCFIGGGLLNDIDDNGHYGVISGGRGNVIQGSASTNCAIGGGAFNTTGVNAKFATIPGGERHSVQANYGFTLGGASNLVTAARAGAIGMNVTNSTVDSTEIGHYNTNKIRIDSQFTRMVNMGTLYMSNTVSWVPTAAQIGVGGYWVGNSNGNLVTIYTLDGSATVMKILAP